MLFIKRQVNAGDRHSGQIAYPGGKVEPGEDDFAAAVRETREEIGFDLRDERTFAYLGQSERNFFAYYKRGKSLMISAHYFLMVRDVEATLAADEVSSVFYEELESFVFPDAARMQFQLREEGPLNVFLRDGTSRLADALFRRQARHLTQTLHFTYRLHNGEIFFGLSLQVLVSFLNKLKSAHENPAELQALQRFANLSKNCVILSDCNSYWRQPLFNTLYFLLRMRQFHDP